MNNLNTLTITGNIVNDPVFKNIGSTDIVEFTVANHRSYKGQETASFFNCKSFGQTAKIINDIAKKGNRIIVSGRIDQEFWEGSDGTKKSKFVVNVTSFEILFQSRKNESNQDSLPPNYDETQPMGLGEEIF